MIINDLLLYFDIILTKDSLHIHSKKAAVDTTCGLNT